MDHAKTDRFALFRSESTVRAYRSDLSKFHGWYVETNDSAPDWQSVSALDIAEFKRSLLNRKQKPATINRALTALWCISTP